MRKPNNSGIDRSSFPYRLTEWLRLDELKEVVSQIRKYEGRQCYGKYYIIKRNKNKTQYGVFTRGLSIEEETG